MRLSKIVIVLLIILVSLVVIVQMRILSGGGGTRGTPRSLASNKNMLQATQHQEQAIAGGASLRLVNGEPDGKQPQEDYVFDPKLHRVHPHASILPKPQQTFIHPVKQAGKFNTMLATQEGKLMIAAGGENPSKELELYVREFIDPTTGAAAQLLEDWASLSPEHFGNVELLDCDTKLGEPCDIIIQEEEESPSGSDLIGSSEGYSMEILPEGVIIRVARGLRLRDAADGQDDEGGGSDADRWKGGVGAAHDDPSKGTTSVQNPIGTVQFPNPISQFAPLQHALHSLFHLALTSASSESTPAFGVIPCLTVLRDKPKSVWRGLHVDTARHFMEVSTLKKVVRRMSRVKMNILHLHLSDDQGWRLESKVFPSLHLVGGKRGPSLNGVRNKKHNGTAYPEPKFFTHAEMHELISFAALRNVRIIPEIDLPAHAAAVITALNVESEKRKRVNGESLQQLSYDISKFGYSAKDGEGNADCKSLSAEEAAKTGAPNCMGGSFGIIFPSENSFSILKDIVGEMCSVFEESPMIHIGGDQAEFLRAQGWSEGTLRAAGVQPFAVPPSYLGGVNFKNDKTFGRLQAFLTDRIIHEIIEDEALCGGKLHHVGLKHPVQRQLRDEGVSSSVNKKRAVVWDETYLMMDKAYYPPNGTVVMLWRYDEATILAQREKQRKIEALARGKLYTPLPFILTSKQRFYLDYVQHHPYDRNRYPRQQRPASYFDYHAVTLKRVFRAHRLSRFVDPEYLNQLGVQACLWTELMFSEEHLLYQLVPRIYAVADVAWTQRTFGKKSDGTEEGDDDSRKKKKKDDEGDLKHPTEWNDEGAAAHAPRRASEQFSIFRAQVERLQEFDVV